MNWRDRGGLRGYQPADAENLSWSHPRVLTILVIIFLFGSAVGTTATHAYLHHKMMHRPPGISVRLNALKAQLQLTPEQEKTVAKELDDYAKYYQNIEEERMDVAQHGKQRIMAVLNPHQRKLFAEMFDIDSR